MLVVEVEFSSYDFDEDDVAALKREFGDDVPLRVSGSWAPAAGVGPTLEFVLTFFGSALAQVILDKALERSWDRIRAGYRRYRDDRARRGKHTPSLGPLVLRADDVEFRINMALDAESSEVADLTDVLAERLADGALRSLHLRSIELPSRQRADGRWETVPAGNPKPDSDAMIWYVMGSSVDGPFGFYDARRDVWISD